MDCERILSIVTSCVVHYRVRQGLTVLKVKPAQGRTATPEPTQFQAVPPQWTSTWPSVSAHTDSFQEFSIHSQAGGMFCLFLVLVFVFVFSGFLLHSPSAYLRWPSLYCHTSLKPRVSELETCFWHSSLHSEAWASDHLVLFTGIFNEFATMSRTNTFPS